MFALRNFLFRHDIRPYGENRDFANFSCKNLRDGPVAWQSARKERSLFVGIDNFIEMGLKDWYEWEYNEVYK